MPTCGVGGCDCGLTAVRAREIFGIICACEGVDETDDQAVWTMFQLMGDDIEGGAEKTGLSFTELDAFFNHMIHEHLAEEAAAAEEEEEEEEAAEEEEEEEDPDPEEDDGEDDFDFDADGADRPDGFTYDDPLDSTPFTEPDAPAIPKRKLKDLLRRIVLAITVAAAMVILTSIWPAQRQTF